MKPKPTAMDVYQQIVRECFWDLNFSAQDIEAIITGDDFRQKQFLFEKILLNSTRMFRDLSLFSGDDLKVLIENYKVPQFNHTYAARRLNLAEVLFLNKPLTVDELKWTI